ncbi:MAG TPA: hypothetical protein VEL74_21095 [Thermoanaerobaculia bacterium]|nr:hypothetical protein [Thermoanaerobaculia bacterium]
MNTFDYLSVLLSIVVGLGLSRMLGNFGELVLQRAKVRFYWVPLVTAAIVFLAHVEFWWSAFGFREIPEWNFFSFILLLFVTIALYMMSVFVLPDPQGEASVDLYAHYYSVRPWFFSTACLYLVLDICFDILVDGEPFLDGVRLFQAAYVGLLTCAAATNRPRLHQSVAVLTLLLFLIQITMLGLEIG